MGGVFLSRRAREGFSHSQIAHPPHFIIYGVVCQKNLGSTTAAIAAAINECNPGASWSQVTPTSKNEALYQSTRKLQAGPPGCEWTGAWIFDVN